MSRATAKGCPLVQISFAGIRDSLDGTPRGMFLIRSVGSTPVEVPLVDIQSTAMHDSFVDIQKWDGVPGSWRQERSFPGERLILMTCLHDRSGTETSSKGHSLA